jgi:CDP-6-deoxy-D-xylo-4-hexulose-3-dehydrase
MIPLMKNAFFKEYETRRALAEFILQGKKLSMGEQCLEFEKAFAKRQERSHAVLFNSGGSANLALMQALRNLGRLSSGDRVGFSALTWSTNVMPVLQMGFVPVPVDCEPCTLNVTSGKLQERIRAVDLKAFFLTNALGFTGDLDAIREVCLDAGIVLLEDNCESLGTELPSGKAGNFGLASTFSFFVAHHMSTIEGGMAATDDDDLADMLRIVRANGWDRNLTAVKQREWRKRFNVSSELQAKYTFYDLGFNFRPTEITGFLGLFQMEFLEENIRIRERNHLRIEKVLKENDDLVPIDHGHISRLSPFALPVLCRNERLKDHYLIQFSGAGIEVRPIIAGNIQAQPFYQRYVRDRFDLPGTVSVDRCGFYCGNYPELAESDIDLICSCLLKSLGEP